MMSLINTLIHKELTWILNVEWCRWLETRNHLLKIPETLLSLYPGFWMWSVETVLGPGIIMQPGETDYHTNAESNERLRHTTYLCNVTIL